MPIYDTFAGKSRDWRRNQRAAATALGTEVLELARMGAPLRSLRRLRVRGHSGVRRNPQSEQGNRRRSLVSPFA